MSTCGSDRKKFIGRARTLASCTGYSFLELIIGSSILFTLLAIAVVNALSLFDFYKLFVASSDLASELQAARLYAVARNSQVALHVDPGRRSYQLIEFNNRAISALKHLPNGVKFINMTRRSIIFHSRGNAVPAGSIIIGNASGSRKVIVNPGGRVRMERLEP